MSLLMDALRKAEQEKKAVTEKLREKRQSLTDKSHNTGELELTPADDDGNEPSQKDKQDDNPAQSQAESATHDSEATTENRGEKLALTPVDMDISADADSAAEKDEKSHTGSFEKDSENTAGEFLNLTSEDSHDLTASGHEENFTIDMSDEAGEQTLATNGEEDDDTLILEGPNDSPAHDPAHDDKATLSETLGESRTHGESSGRRQFADESPVTDVSGFSPVAARNVFAARKNASQATLTVILLVVFIIIGLTAAGVFYYYSVTPAARPIVSPRVAQEVEANQQDRRDVLPEVDETVAETGSLPELPAGIQDVRPADNKMPDRGNTASQTPPAESVSDPAQDQNSAKQAAPASEPEKKVVAEDEGEADKSDETPLHEETSQTAAMPDEELELKPELLQISRSQSQDTVSPVIQDAYGAYRDGDLEQARQLYQSVRKQAPDNRNVLLGLAAIAVQQKRIDDAYRYYAEILRRNPADDVAGAAMINLGRHADPATAESRLKQLLEQQPETAYLYEALGHVYARTKRWPQAQQAYFDAFSRDSSNPDYAYNLAVSLDHLEQQGAAITYYEKALDLSQAGPAGFSRESARQRLEQIR